MPSTEAVARQHFLAGTLMIRFNRSFRQADLDDARQAGRQALDGTPSEHPSWIERATLYAIVSRRRFEEFGGLDDLSEAIRFGRAVIALPTPSYLDRGVLTTELGLALMHRFAITGDDQDLDEAICFIKEAAASTPTGDLAESSRAGCLGMALITRFQHSGDVAALDEAIINCRHAVDHAPGAGGRAAWLSNLMSVLGARFARFGDQSDLEAAITAGREAVASTSTTDPGIAATLSELGRLLPYRFTLIGDLADLDEAVHVTARAVKSTPQTHPRLPQRQHRAAVALLERFYHTSNAADPEHAIDLMRACLRLTSTDQHPQPIYLGGLAQALLARFGQHGDEADLTESIQFSRSALRGQAGSDPDRAAALYTLGKALLHLSTKTHNAADLQEALDALEEAAAVPTTSISARMTAAELRGRAATAMGQWETALDACVTAVSLLPMLTWQGIGRASQEHSLIGQSGLATTAAAVALEADHADTAVEFLERSRNVLWSHGLARRTDLTQLEQLRPALAAQLQRLCAELEYLSSPMADGRIDERIPPSPTSARMQYANVI